MADRQKHRQTERHTMNLREMTEITQKKEMERHKNTKRQSDSCK